MAMLIAPETPYGKELWRWEHHEGETHPSDSSIRGMGARGFKPYPAMLYQVTQKNPWKWESVQVHSEMEQQNYESRGFVAGGLKAACDEFDANQQRLAVAAAERNYADRNMSEKAKAHRDEVEQASSVHLGEIPETPIKRRGRPKKAEPTT